MTFEPGAIIGGAGCGIGLAALILARIYHRAALRNSERMREEWEREQLHCGTRIETLSRHVEGLETSMRNADEILREGRLNQSGRAHALQLLRSGVSPDSAAASLGMPRRELRLLSKVSRLICAYR